MLMWCLWVRHAVEVRHEKARADRMCRVSTDLEVAFALAQPHCVLEPPLDVTSSISALLIGLPSLQQDRASVQQHRASPSRETAGARLTKQPPPALTQRLIPSRTLR